MILRASWKKCVIRFRKENKEQKPRGDEIAVLTKFLWQWKKGSDKEHKNVGLPSRTILKISPRGIIEAFVEAVNSRRDTHFWRAMCVNTHGRWCWNWFEKSRKRPPPWKQRPLPRMPMAMVSPAVICIPTFNDAHQNRTMGEIRVPLQAWPDSKRSAQRCKTYRGKSVEPCTRISLREWFRRYETTLFRLVCK